jgi:hypothetical protein
MLETLDRCSTSLVELRSFGLSVQGVQVLYEFCSLERPHARRVPVSAEGVLLSWVCLLIFISGCARCVQWIE